MGHITDNKVLANDFSKTYYYIDQCIILNENMRIKQIENDVLNII